jgi:hypothetical protein
MRDKMLHGRFVGGHIIKAQAGWIGILESLVLFKEIMIS